MLRQWWSPPYEPSIVETREYMVTMLEKERMPGRTIKPAEDVPNASRGIVLRLYDPEFADTYILHLQPPALIRLCR